MINPTELPVEALKAAISALEGQRATEAALIAKIAVHSPGAADARRPKLGKLESHINALLKLLTV
jgi:hypothetical protein